MIPTVEDLASSPLAHRFGDVFNPPGLTNFLGTVQCDVDVCTFRNLCFPPFVCADNATAGLFVDDVYFPTTGTPVTFTWYPDRIERQATYRGLRLRSTLALAADSMTAMLHLAVTNESGVARDVNIRLGLQSNVGKLPGPWLVSPPQETGNDAWVEHERGRVHFAAKRSDAHLLQGAVPQPHGIDPESVWWRVQLEPGDTWQATLVTAIGETASEVSATYDCITRDVRGAFATVTARWNHELQAAFTPDNGIYSGHLPELDTDDEDIARLYATGVLGVVYFRRDSPHSRYGRTYTTLMPRYWPTVTFLWDYSLSSLVHALLDPEIMRGNLERWMRFDIHDHFGTEYLSGEPVGPWYSVNDYAWIATARDYLRWSGDLRWLQRELPSGDSGAPIRVAEQVIACATNWLRFQGTSGLADYGDINNLLECVTTYIHEVAGLNAANVFSMRFAAEACADDPMRAATLNDWAGRLLREVQNLYVDGRGYWRSRNPDGTMREVRHCYDLITVLNTIPDDLSAQQRREMADFWRRELRTPVWMRALSGSDPDAMRNTRPDHQWTGAYTAWPALAVTGLYRIGRVDLAFPWLRGLARSANQGPFAQAHFNETAVEPDAGGARKAPPEQPWITDWCCSSGGAWVNVVVESIFGVRATLRDGISAEPQFGAFDPSARLRNLRHQGRLYDVDARGLHPAG
jgi:hypothetical protein